MFIDSAVIEVCSGKGGDGCVSFRREKYLPKGGPNGGNGGRGGSVHAIATTARSTLLDFSGHHHWRAENGQPGRSKQQYGRDGEDLRIQLPVGTLIFDEASSGLVADLKHSGDLVLLAEGGRGGFGNEHFKGPTNQTPRQSTPGGAGQQLVLRLELKLLADVGLVGKPNAGKSTLLARISRATPKIADYPFTTLEPQLGIAELAGLNSRRLVVADIPGLITNAHRGEGLGTRFLRHIERTSVLVHMLELNPIDGTDPVANYHLVRRELELFSPALARKPELVVLSKMDLFGNKQDRLTAVRQLQEALGRPIYPISASAGLGLRELLEACWIRHQQNKDRI